MSSRIGGEECKTVKLEAALKATSQKLDQELRQQTRFYHLIELCELNKDMNEEWIRVAPSNEETELFSHEYHQVADSNTAAHQAKLC